MVPQEEDSLLSIEQVLAYLEAFLAGEPVATADLAETLRLTQIYLESESVPLLSKARLQQLELLVLDSYPVRTEPESRLLLTIYPVGQRTLAMPLVLRGVEAVLDLLLEVARVMDLVFTPTYELLPKLRLEPESKSAAKV